MHRTLGAFWYFCRPVLLSPGTFAVRYFCRLVLLSSGPFVDRCCCRPVLLSFSRLSPSRPSFVIRRTRGGQTARRDRWWAGITLARVSVASPPSARLHPIHQAAAPDRCPRYQAPSTSSFSDARSTVDTTEMHVWRRYTWSATLYVAQYRWCIRCRVELRPLLLLLLLAVSSCRPVLSAHTPLSLPLSARRMAAAESSLCRATA